MTETIFLLENYDDINQLKQSLINYKNYKIFALDYFTHYNLTKNKILHDVGDDYLTEQDKKLIDDKSIDTIINWKKNDSIKNYLIFDGINLASLIEIESVMYFTRIFMTAITVMRLIENEKPRMVVVSTHLNDFVVRICKSKNIQVVVQGMGEQPTLYYDRVNIKFNLLSHPISFIISRQTYVKLRNITSKIINSIFNLNPDFKLAMKKSILLLDFNPAQYDILIKELSNLDKNVLLLNQRRPAIWNMKSFKVVKNSNCKIIDLDQFENKIYAKIQKELDNLSDNLIKLWKNDDIFEKIFSMENYTFWYSIKNSFIKTCNYRFKESVRRILLDQELLNTFNVSVILEWAETGQEEKEILSIAKKRGIKIVYLPHAMYTTAKLWDPFARFLGYFSYPLISDKQIVWGELSKEYALSHGYKNENLLVIGSPRHDVFFNYNKNVESKGIILLATTGIAGIAAETSTISGRVKFDDFVKEVCRVAKNFPDKQLVVKPHPNPEFFINIIELIKEIDPNIPVLVNANLPELISTCDIVITFTNSTIALESIIMNKPTMSLQIEKWAEEDEIAKMGAVLSITDIGDIENGIRKLLYDEKFRYKIQENAKQFLNRYLSNEGHASKILAKLLDTF